MLPNHISGKKFNHFFFKNNSQRIEESNFLITLLFIKDFCVIIISDETKILSYYFWNYISVNSNIIRY